MRAAAAVRTDQMLALVNSRSGSNEGADILIWLRNELGSARVFDLTKHSPTDVLLEESRRPAHERASVVLVCGGDGTVAWVLAALDDLVFDEPNAVPAVAVLPLGTGNDFSRAVGFGATWDGIESLPAFLANLPTARDGYFDRWRVQVTTLDTTLNPQGTKFYTMQNYLSFGCDAGVCAQFHQLRETLPALCSSRLGNKMLYTIGGTKAFFEEHVALEKEMNLFCDGKRVPLPSDVYGLMFLNINSYAGGADLWGDEDEGFKRQSYDDGIMEVVGVSGTFLLGASAVGLAQGTKIAQGKEFALEFRGNSPVYYQLDGEPCVEPLKGPAMCRIRFFNKARVLTRTITKPKSLFGLFG